MSQSSPGHDVFPHTQEHFQNLHVFRCLVLSLLPLISNLQTHLRLMPSSVFPLLLVAHNLTDNLQSTILVKILGTSHKIALLQSLIQWPPLPPFQCWLNCVETPFDHPSIELGGGRRGMRRF